jgi:hypothetical protein
MKRFVAWTTMALLGLAIAGGCGKKAATSDAATAPKNASGVATQTPAGEIQLAGTLGCGHCVFHTTSDCAAVVKTASGELYVLDGIDAQSPLWEKRLEEGHTITVAGTVVAGNAGDLKHFAMKSYEMQ